MFRKWLFVGLMIALLAPLSSLYAQTPQPDAVSDDQASLVTPKSQTSPANAVAEDENSQRLIGPTGTDYYNVAGTAFLPRDHQLQYQYGSSGCVYMTNDGGVSGDNRKFVTGINLPDGAELEGIRFYVRDFNANLSTGAAYSFDGAGSAILIDSIDSVGNSGFESNYLDFTPAVAVNNNLRSYVMTWEPSVVGSGQQLCGARVFFRHPETQSASRYHFMSGDMFHPRDSDEADVVYNGRGCISTVTSGAVTADVNLPAGAKINALTLYSYATESSLYGASFTVYNGVDSFTDISATIPAEETPLYGVSTYAFPEPYVVNPSVEAMVVSLNLPSNGNTKFCGVRIAYTQGTAQFLPRPDDAERGSLPVFPPRRYYERSIAGSAFIPRQSDVTYNYAGNGCITSTDTGAVFVADLQLPSGAFIDRFIYFYKDTINTVNSSLSITRYNADNSVTNIASMTSVDDTFARYFPINPDVLVDNGEGAMIFDWRPFTDQPGIKLCQGRVTYWLEADYVMLPMVRR